MYSWKTIRTVCAVLLLIPIIHLAYLVSREILTSLEVAPTAWASEVDSYAELDQSMHLPLNPIVVVGGRRVKLWRGLEDMLSPQPVLMRGLGGATVDDIAHYHPQLIGFYRPQSVVLLPGSSEFHVRDNKSAEELTAAIRNLVKLDLSHEITQKFYVFAPIKAPLYPRDNTRIDNTTVALKRWSEAEERVTILDANPLLVGENGNPNPDFYRIDGINLNEHGYLRLSMLLLEQMEDSNSTE